MSLNCVFIEGMPNTRIGPVIMSPGNDKADSSNSSQKFSPANSKKTKNRKASKSLISQLVDESDVVTQSCHRCNKGFGDGALSVQCDRCNEWYHLCCTTSVKLSSIFLENATIVNFYGFMILETLMIRTKFILGLL